MMRVFVYEHLSGLPSAAADTDLLAAGLAMRDAVVRDLLCAGDCAIAVAAGASAHKVPAGARAVQPPAGATAFEFVALEAARHDGVWVIAPETDGVLAQLQRAVVTPRWLGCTAEAIALAASKRATLARAAQHGVLTPLAFAASPATRGWVVKPDDGAGALATQVHQTLAAAQADAGARERRGLPTTLEPWVDGEPLSLSLLCAAGHTELLSVNRQQLAIAASGNVSFTGVQADVLARGDARTPTLQAWAQALADAVPGLRGYVGVDLVWHPHEGPVLIEINPRVTMAYVGLSATLGRNLAAAVLAAHALEFAHAAA